MSCLSRKIPSSNEIIVYKSKVKEELICPTCLEVFEKPMLLQCGHTVCSPCLIRIIKQKPECPICKYVINDEKKQSNLLISSLIGNLKIYCKYGIIWNQKDQDWEKAEENDKNFCHEIIKRTEKENHEVSCKYSLKQCKYWIYGCTDQIPLIYLDDHEKQCPFIINENLEKYKKEVSKKIESLSNSLHKEKEKTRKLQEKNILLEENLQLIYNFLKTKYNEEEIPKIIFNKEEEEVEVINENESKNDDEIEILDHISTHVDGNSKEIEFYNYYSNLENKNLTVIHELKHSGGVESIVQSEEYLITGCWNGTINVRYSFLLTK